MKSFSEMSYDEQRKLLGLPHVRLAVMATQIGIAGRQMVAAGTAFARVFSGKP